MQQHFTNLKEKNYTLFPFTKTIKNIKWTLLMMILLMTGKGWGQQSITNAGSPNTQNFNSIGSTATASLPTGFKIGTNWSSGTTATTRAAGTSGTGILTGTSAAGVYNFANGITASSTDRAIGFLSSGSYTSPRSIIYAFTNNTGSTITSIDISWNYEKYRSGSRAFAWTFFHGSTSTASTAATSGDLSYTADANNTVISNPPLSSSKSFSITGLSIANGATYYLRWTYTGSGGSTNAQGLAIDDFSITLNAAAATPTISTTGTPLSVVNTTYGTNSSNTTFNVSGANMTAGISINPPAGYQVSTVSDFSSNVGTNGSPITVGAAGTIASTPIYVRIPATTAAGTYSGNIVLASSGATNVNVATVSSTVSTKSLTVTGLSASNKVYNGTTAVTVTGTPAFSGLVNAESFSPSGTVSWAFPNANVGNGKTLSRTGSYSSPSANYTVTQPTLTADITAKVLTITANDVSKPQGTTLTGGSGSTAFSSSGLENSENIGSVTISYGSAGAASGDGNVPGVYPNQVTPSVATGGTFSSSNYSISYVSGSITVTAVSTPTLSASSLTDFGNQCIGECSAEKSFTITGNSLTSVDVTVTALSGYTLCATAGGTYTSSLNFTQGGGAFSQTVYVKFCPAAVQSYNGNIVVAGGGASSENVAVTGVGVNTAPSVTAGAATSITNSSATTPGSITVIGCSAISAYGVEYSTTSGFANGSGTQVVGSNLSGGSFSVGLSGLNYSTIYYFKTYATNGGGTSYSAQGSFTTLTPTITVGSITAFDNQCINTTSSEKTYNVSGINLTANITVTAPTGYQVSTTSGSNFGSSVTLNHSGGTVASTPIYVRFAPTAVQAYSGNITHASTGATTQNVAVSGSGINTAPSISTVTASSISTSSASSGGNTITAGCANITAKGVVWGTSSNPTVPSANSTDEGSGTSDFTSSITGLLANTTYYYRAYATSSAGTSYGSNLFFTTLKVAPTTQAASFTFSSVATTSLTASWTNGNGDKRIVIMNTSNSFTDPIDGTDPTANAAYSGSGEQVVFNGTGTSVAITGLTQNTTYWFRVYEYNNTGVNTKYITSTGTDNPLSESTIDGPCASEDFTNIPTGSSSSYSSRSWTGTDGGTWTATDARTDQTITGKAITVRTGVLTSPTKSGGISDLIFKTKFPYSESSGTLTIAVNGTTVGTVAYADMNGTTPITKTISNINTPGNVVVTLTSSVARFTIDDISWTCFADCTPPSDPVGSISVAANPACSSTHLSFPESVVPNVIYYWQTTDNGNSSLNATTGSADYEVSTTGIYYVRAYDSDANCWSTNSISSDNIVINTPIGIGNHGSDRTVAAGTDATFTISSITGTSPTYKWQENTGSGWSDLSNGASYTNVTTASLTVLAPTLAMNNYKYRCVVSGASPCTEVISNELTLTVNNPSPNNVSATTAGCATNSTQYLSWSAPATGTAPDGYMVFAVQASTVGAGTPTNAQDYTANTDFSQATTYGTLGKCVYKGATRNVTISGLTMNSNYSYRVFAYIGETATGWSTATTSGSKAENRTAVMPVVSAVNASIANGQSLVGWTKPSPNTCYDEMVVFARQGGAVTHVPSGDGSVYTANAVFGSGTNLGNDEFVVAKITSASTPSFTCTGLSIGTEYCFVVYLRKGEEWSQGVSTCVIPSIPVPDNGCGSNNFAEMTINYPDNLIITDVNVGVRAYTTYRGDLKVSLVSPMGTEILLQNQVGGSADDLDVLFDDAGAGNTSSGNHTVGGAYDVESPVQGTDAIPLSTLNGELSQGVWTLKVCDAALSDFAYLVGFELFITGSVPCTPAGNIVSFAPNNGPQGTLVTIVGSGFETTSSVLFGTTAASSYSISTNGDTIYAVVPNIDGEYNIKIEDSEACEFSSISNFTVISSSGACGSSGTLATDLFISEVFDATSGDGSYIEVFNGTASAIDLSSPQYRLTVLNNGSTYTHLDLTGTLNPGEVYLLRTGNSAAPCGVSPTHYNGTNQLTFNGDDEVFLYKSGSILDYVPNPNAGTGFSQIRKSSVTSPATVYDASEWVITSEEECGNLGVGPYESGTNVEIVVNPVNHSACAIEFSVTANVSPGTITYQWKYHNGANAASWANVEQSAFPDLTIVGENSADLIMTGYLEPYNGYQFYCEVSSTEGNCIKVTSAGRFTIENKPVFRTVASISGNWTDVANWEMALTDEGPWEAACVYPKAQNSTEIIIQPGTDVVLDTDVDADKLIIDGELEISTNTKLTILNGNAGADMILSGTLIYRANSVNSIVFEDNSGTVNDASWIFEEGATFITTNTGSTTGFRDFYQGGMSNIPATGSWIYLYNGDGNVPTSTVNMYYPDLYFDNSTGSPYSWNTLSTALTGGNGGYSIVKGDLKIGTNSNASCTVYNNNVNENPMMVHGDLEIAENSVFTNESYDGTNSASRGNGTGIEVKGNMLINGTFDFSFGNGLLRLSGTTLQSISSTESGTVKTNNFSLNNTQNAELQGVDLQIANVLTFANGKIITNIASSDKVLIENSSNTAIVGANLSGSDKFIQGKLQWKLLSGFEYSFPIGYAAYGAQGFAITPAGSDNSYVLGFLEPNSTSPLLTVAYCDLESGSPGIGNGQAGYDGVKEKVVFDLSSPLQWDITNPGGGITNYDLEVFPSGLQDISPVVSANGIPVKYLMRNGRPGNPGVSQGNGGHSGHANGFLVCPNGNSLSAMNGFSKFTINGASPDNTLPVELISFEVVCKDKIAVIQWTTATEVNNSHFVVEYSIDAVNWNYLTTVQGSGNSSSPINYEYATNQNKYAYFRLIQVDFDGQQTIYGPINNNCSNESSKLLTKIYPNPFNQEINLFVDDAQSSFFVVEMMDMNGRIVQRNEFFNQSQVVLSTQDLVKGIYTLRVISHSQTETFKMIKQ